MVAAELLAVADDLLTPGEVARLFHVSSKTVTRWAVAGQLRSVKTPGGHHRFYAADIAGILNPRHVEHSSPPT